MLRVYAAGLPWRGLHVLGRATAQATAHPHKTKKSPRIAGSYSPRLLLFFYTDSHIL